MKIEDKIHKKMLKNIIHKELYDINSTFKKFDMSIDFSYSFEQRHHEMIPNLVEYSFKVNNHSYEYYYLSKLSYNIQKIKRLFDEINKYYENRR